MSNYSPFLLIPSELVERILLFCDARDISKFAQTCRAAHNLIYESPDLWLWRELFLAHPFDDIRHALLLGRDIPPVIDWKTELQRRIEAQVVSQSFSPLMLLGPKISFDRVLETFIWVLETASPISPHEQDSVPAQVFLPAPSANLEWIENVLRNSLFLFADAFWSSETSKKLQSRLRAHFYLCYDETSTEEMRKRMNAARRTSRCYVYDLRRYGEASLWGPFFPTLDPEDLRVDWTHVEHIVNVVAMKLRELPPIARRIFKPPFFGLHATRAYSAPGSAKKLPWDWAGVTGVWRRMVCFMDYRDLFAFNFSSSHSGPRNPAFFDDDYQEALRPVELQLEALEPEEVVDPNEKYPVLYYKGSSRGSYSPEASVNGSVRMLKDGQIRWTFVIKTTRYDGSTQWSAEGVQLGNLCSAAGIAGVWTGAFHEEGDPAGPFWMWKVADEDSLANTLIDTPYNH